LKLQIQLGKELKVFKSFTEFQAIAELAVAVDKQSGGWRKRLAAADGRNRSGAAPRPGPARGAGEPRSPCAGAAFFLAPTLHRRVSSGPPLQTEHGDRHGPRPLSYPRFANKGAASIRGSRDWAHSCDAS
jgi:hypothetical protein